MKPTGILDDGGKSLVLKREFNAPVAEVWTYFAESNRLDLWFGSWSGNPEDGFVMLSMSAEAEAGPPSRCEINTCDAPNELSVTSAGEFGSWNLAAEFAEVSSGTQLTFRHIDVDLAGLAQIGPGWEWYLDRLSAVIEGGSLPGLEDFETVYMSLSNDYAALAEPN